MHSRPTRSDPPASPMRWSCRYSSSEMMYLELTTTGVRCYLDHSPDSAEHTSFAELFAGKLDGTTTNLFGADALEQIKAEARQRTAGESAGHA